MIACESGNCYGWRNGCKVCLKVFLRYLDSSPVCGLEIWVGNSWRVCVVWKIWVELVDLQMCFPSEQVWRYLNRLNGVVTFPKSTSLAISKQAEWWWSCFPSEQVWRYPNRLNGAGHVSQVNRCGDIQTGWMVLVMFPKWTSVAISKQAEWCWSLSVELLSRVWLSYINNILIILEISVI